MAFWQKEADSSCAHVCASVEAHVDLSGVLHRLE